MIKLLRLRAIALMLAGILILAPAPSAPASDMGEAAADQVDIFSYMDFMFNWLYTHLGDSRGVNGPEHDPCRDNIQFLFESYGLDVTLEPFDYSGNTYYNVVAVQLGSVFPDQEYILGAHYDSVNNPGADDDASGVALMLEAARILTQYDSEYTLRFIAFDREEQGLIGSYAYVAAHAGDDIQAMVQADMVAYNTGANLADIFGGSGSLILRNDLAEAVTLYGQGLSYELRGASCGSDHCPFELAGYQACMFIEDWGNPYYHTPLDSVDTTPYLDYEFATRMTRTIVGYLVDHAGVNVVLNYLSFSYPNGKPEFVSPGGDTTMMVEVSGVGTAVPQSGTGLLHYDDGSGWQSVSMVETAPDAYEAMFPAAACGQVISYYVSAQSVEGETFTDPLNAPTTSYSATAAYGRTPFMEETFAVEPDPSWTISGRWMFGEPIGGGGSNGGPDPTAGNTDANVYGFNLFGDYTNNLAEYHLTSTAYDCTGLFDVHLTFWRWLGVEDPSSDHTYVRVSNNGVDWTTVWENSGEVADTSWVEMELDIAAVADNQSTVYLRWTMGETDASGTYCGWNIDDIALTTLECDAPCPGPDGDMDGNGTTDGLDLQAFISAMLTAPSPDDLCHGDFSGNGTLGLEDVAGMVAALLAG